MFELGYFRSDLFMAGILRKEPTVQNILGANKNTYYIILIAVVIVDHLKQLGSFHNFHIYYIPS